MPKKGGGPVLPVIVTNRRDRRIVPVALGLGMLAVVLAAGFFPNTGTVQAQSSCPYGGCTTSSSIPTWELVSILVLVAAAIIAAALILMRRRRPPAASTVQAWKGAPPAGAAGAVPSAPSGPPAPYIEGPEDVGHAPPAISPKAATGTAATGAGAGAGAAAAPAAAAGEPDIDSLMAELDKISGEILKKPTKKGPGDTGEETTESAGKSP